MDNRIIQSRNALLLCNILSSLKMILFLCIILSISESVVIKFKKQYINIANNSYYIFKLAINQTQSQINPINVAIFHEVYNTYATTNQYFDYFKYLSKEDLKCYGQSIGNMSYLYPCPFILNGDQALRTYDVADQLKKTQGVRGSKYYQQSFIVDNTPYPFPAGAFSYTNLSISSSSSLTIQFNDQYKDVGIRLIFITVTLLGIYGFVIGILVYKTNKIQKQMLLKKPDYDLKQRVSQMNRVNTQIKQQDQQSDIDNYEQIVNFQLGRRDSRNSRQVRQQQFKNRQFSPKRASIIEEIKEQQGSVSPIKKIDLQN